MGPPYGFGAKYLSEFRGTSPSRSPFMGIGGGARPQRSPPMEMGSGEDNASKNIGAHILHSLIESSKGDRDRGWGT